MNSPKTSPSQSQPMAGWEKIVIALLVLVGAGGWTMAHQGLAEKRATAETAAQTRMKEIERLNGERTRLAAGSGLSAPAGENAEAGSAATAGSATAAAPGASAGAATAASGPARTEAMMRLADLLEKGILAGTPMPALAIGRPAGAGPALPPYAINAQGQLQPGFGQLFGLSEDQVGRLQEKITSLKQQVESSAMAGTTVEQTGENSYSLTMQPLANAAQSRDELVAAFKDALGEDGYRLFAALNGERVTADGTRTGGPANLLAQFGGDPRTMTVTRGPNGFQYSVKSGNSSGSGSGADLTNLSARLGPGVSLLPSAFLTAPFPNRTGGGAGGAGGGGRGGDNVMQFTSRTGEGETTTTRMVTPATGAGTGDTFIVPSK